MKITLLISILIFLTQISFAQETSKNQKTTESKSSKQPLKKLKIKNQRALFDGSKMIEVKLAYPDWNKSPEAINNGVILLKDGNSNKVVQVLLEESAPDSNIFSGTYSVNWGSSTQVKPEVYVLQSTDLLTQEELKSTLAKIASGNLKRKPVIFRKNEIGTQVLEVFDTTDKAKEALTLLKNQREFKSNFETTSITGKDLGVAKKLLDSDELQKMATDNTVRLKENQKRLLDRYRQEQIEKQRIETLVQQQKKLTVQEKEKRERAAEEYAASALDFYRANNFKEAEGQFKKSFDLNPDNKKYYFQYGITLYKNEKYNDAIVILGIAKQMSEFQLEASYYIGLCQYSLKEYESALSTFQDLKVKKDDKFSPLGSFYSGMTYYDQKSYEKAKTEFELVLDTSKDPRLDEKSERYIDIINQLMQLAKMRENKFFLSATAGALYDSNVLQQSDSSGDQGSATDKASLRFITGLGFYYRPIFDSKTEFGPKIRTDYIYTQKNDLSEYDPLSLQLTAPYSRRGEWFGKPHILSLKPGYELLHLGQEDSSGRPKKTLKAYFAEWDNTFIMKDDWYTGGGLTVRKEDFFEDADQGKNALKYTLKWTNIFLVNDAKTKSILADMGLTLNNADSSDSKSQRLDVSGLYVMPVLKDSATFIGGLSVYRLIYPDKTTKQTDMNYTLSANLAKQLNDWLSGTVLSSYTLNKSDVSSAEYKRWSIGVVFSTEFAW